MLQNECLLARIGIDTAENEPPKFSLKWGIDPSPRGGVDLLSKYRSGICLVLWVLVVIKELRRVAVPARVQ